MGALVSYQLAEAGDPVATVTMDDGKVNALSPALQAELHAALDQAQADGAVVVVAGRDGVFSAGFDLDTLNAGGPEAIAMVEGGFELAARVLAFPAPVVMACTGHAVAMGVFLLLSGDYRVGASGPYRLQANEVAIGLTLPHAAVEVLRQRLTPAAFDRAAILAEAFGPTRARPPGSSTGSFRRAGCWRRPGRRPRCSRSSTATRTSAPSCGPPPGPRRPPPGHRGRQGRVRGGLTPAGAPGPAPRAPVR